MPHVACGSCGVRVYTAALYAGVDRCGRCGAELPRAERWQRGPIPLLSRRSRATRWPERDWLGRRTAPPTG